MAYKQPSTGPFKMMGSSPAKYDGPNLSPKLLALKKQRETASNAGKIIKFGEGSNIIPDADDTVSRNFNTKGSKGTVGKTPGYSTTKVSKASKFIKGAKKVLKVGGKITGGLGIAGTLYDMYKSGQEHSGGKAVKGQKSFMADAKKNTKSIYKKK